MNMETRYLPVSHAQLATRLSQLLEQGGRLQFAYGWRPPGALPEVRYVAATKPLAPLEVWCCTVDEGGLPSLAREAPLLAWYEREMQELDHLIFRDGPEPYPLIARGPSQPPDPDLRDVSEALQPGGVLPVVDDPEVQILPFGPVRSDVLESAQFVFLYLGEAIAHYVPRLFVKHRAMERRFVGCAPDRGTLWAEQVSGVGCVAHCLAFCQAVEDAARVEVPERAQWLRTGLAELERIYNHLHYFAMLTDATTLKVAQAEARLLEERAKQLAAQWTGHRFMRHVLVPGGLRRDLPFSSGLLEMLHGLRDDTASYLKALEGTTSYLDRLMGTGILTAKVAFDQGATGPVERASGLDRDLRRDQPYAAYANLSIPVLTAPEGDAFARARVRATELMTAFELFDAVIGHLPEGPFHRPCRPPPLSCGLGWAESPRGSLYYAIHLDDQGQFARVKIKSPSFSNWRAFPFTVHQTNMMDYAINEASFGLTIAGCAR